MLVMPSLKKSLIVEQFQGNYLNVEANRVRAVTACHAFRSRAGLQGFRSEIEYLIFDQVRNRVGKITDCNIARVLAL